MTQVIEDHGQMIRAIHQYKDGSPSEARKYLTQYFEERGEKTVLGYLEHSVKDEYIPKEYAWAAKLFLDGVDIQCYDDIEELHAKIKKSVWDVLPSLPEVVKKPVKKTYGGEIEAAVDEFITNGCKIREVEFDTYEYLDKEKVPQAETRSLIKHFTEMKEELEQIDSDSQLKEAYAYLGKRNRNNYIKFLSGILDGCGSYIINNRIRNKVSKPVKRKKLAKVNYMESCDELQFVSEDPLKIDGSNEVWLLHEKYNMLYRYRAKDNSGLKLNGSKIENYNEKTSKNKKMKRKFIPSLFKLGKRQMTKQWKDLKRTEYDNNGRINKNMLILKIFK